MTVSAPLAFIYHSKLISRFALDIFCGNGLQNSQELYKSLFCKSVEIYTNIKTWALYLHMASQNMDNEFKSPFSPEDKIRINHSNLKDWTGHIFRFNQVVAKHYCADDIAILITAFKRNFVLKKCYITGGIPIIEVDYSKALDVYLDIFSLFKFENDGGLRGFYSNILYTHDEGIIANGKIINSSGRNEKSFADIQLFLLAGVYELDKNVQQAYQSIFP
jgi:hypothetical protein